MLTGIIINLVVTIIGWLLTHRKASMAAAQSIENGKILDAIHLSVGLLSATEARRQHALQHPVQRGGPNP